MAKRFQFKLEAVQRVRHEAERSQQRVVAEVVGEMARLDSGLLAIRGELAALVEEGRQTREETALDMIRLRQSHLYRGRLTQRLAELSGERAAVEERLTAERLKLVEAAKQRKAIEKLRERQWMRYRQQVNREEQAVTDEVAIQMSNRRRLNAVCPEGA